MPKKHPPEPDEAQQVSNEERIELAVIAVKRNLDLYNTSRLVEAITDILNRNSRADVFAALTGAIVGVVESWPAGKLSREEQIAIIARSACAMLKGR
jgi:hypothetical protein